VEPGAGTVRGIVLQSGSKIPQPPQSPASSIGVNRKPHGGGRAWIPAVPARVTLSDMRLVVSAADPDRRSARGGKMRSDSTAPARAKPKGLGDVFDRRIDVEYMTISGRREMATKVGMSLQRWYSCPRRGPARKTFVCPALRSKS